MIGLCSQMFDIPRTWCETNKNGHKNTACNHSYTGYDYRLCILTYLSLCFELAYCMFLSLVYIVLYLQLSFDSSSHLGLKPIVKS